MITSSLLNSFILTNITIPPEEIPIVYDGYEYKLRTQLVNKTLTLANNFTRNITSGHLYENYVYSFWCSFGVIGEESILGKTKVFLITAEHCLKHTYQFSRLRRPKTLETLMDCMILHSDSKLDLGVIVCNAYGTKTNTFIPMKPFLADNKSLPINSGIRYVAKFAFPLTLDEYMFPENFDCKRKDEKICDGMLSNALSYWDEIVQLSEPVGHNLGQQDTFFHSPIGSFIQASGALASFNDNEYFDAILLGNIPGATEEGTQFVSTRNEEFYVFYAEVLQRIENYKEHLS
jgi:hypothetical protein